MITHLKGTILLKDPEYIVLDVSGVGYKIHITPNTLANTPHTDNELSLWISMIIRETAMDLYGFLDTEEKSLFEMLLSVSGVGPKSALGIIGLAGVDTLLAAISKNEISYLTKVSGVGKKSAEKIVLELRDKVGNIAISDSINKDDADVVDGLKAMGYSLQEARDAIKNIPNDVSGTNDRLKSALKQLL